MAEESVDLLVTAPKNNLDSRNSGRKSVDRASHLIGNNSAPRDRRASLGSSLHGDSSRRNSSGKSSSPKDDQDVIPHYLRASTGSCHDFCKYGRKHTFEAKPWRPLTKTITKTPSDEIVSGGSAIPLEKKKLTVVNHVASHESKAHAEVSNPSPDTNTISHDSPEIIKHEISLPSKSVEGSLKKKLATRKIMPKEEREMNHTSRKLSPEIQPKAVVMKSSPSYATSEGKNLKGRRKSDIKDSKPVVTAKASLKKGLEPPDGSSSSRASISKSVSLKSKKSRNAKLLTPLKDQNRIQKAISVKPKNEKIPEKTLHVVSTETVNSLVESLQNGDAIALHPTQSNRSPRFLSYPSHSLSSHEDLVDEEEVEEEEDVEAGVDEGEDTEHKNHEAGQPIKVYKKTDISVKKVVGGNRSRTLEKGGAVVSKDKDSSLMKMKFRRGMVIELQSDNDSPRRLRFRRGRVFVGNQDGRADGKRVFKKKSVVDDKGGKNPSSEKVVLRHQDVQDKKDSQGLLNNVIEETASKLVESRKSKVKALVGAFETVISLQESKPSPNPVS